MTPKIETERLLLRPIDTSDATAVFKLVNNRNVAKWLTAVPWPYTMRDAEEFVARSRKQETGEYHIIEIEGQLAGCISCAHMKDLGYWLGEPYWGRGFMGEAAKAVTKAFFAKGHDELQSGYVLGNVGSQRILENLGFQNTKVIDARPAAQSGEVRVQKMRLTRASWEQAA